MMVQLCTCSPLSQKRVTTTKGKIYYQECITALMGCREDIQYNAGILWAVKILQQRQY